MNPGVTEGHYYWAGIFFAQSNKELNILSGKSAIYAFPFQYALSHLDKLTWCWDGEVVKKIAKAIGCILYEIQGMEKSYLCLTSHFRFLTHVLPHYVLSSMASTQWCCKGGVQPIIGDTPGGLWGAKIVSKPNMDIYFTAEFNEK